jgi:hypothetical protein
MVYNYTHGYDRALSGLLDIPVEHVIGSYQGDWLAVVVDENAGDSWTGRGGFVSNAFGSCSGCDSWIAARTVEARLELLAQVVNSVRWFDEPASLLAWLEDDDRELEWFYHEEQYEDFLAKVRLVVDGADTWSDVSWKALDLKEKAK